MLGSPVLPDAQRAQAVVDRIGALEVGEQMTEDQGAEVAALFAGDGELLRLLSERPGHWLLATSVHGRYLDSEGRPWHAKLREAQERFGRYFEALGGRR